ncbi:MAG: XrtA system polysaccharide deacetylase [Caldilineaceae bacterium]
MQNALSIDVEEHFQVHAFETLTNRSEWDNYPSRVVANTERILRLLAKYQVRATFFILGWVAERHPELVCAIADGGHEVATHGYWHELIYRQSPESFGEDLRRSLEVIQKALAGRSVTTPVQIEGYRAPAFSITKQSLWALDVLHEQGIRYDSSIFPLVAHDRYGISDASRFANRLKNGMWEFPVSTVVIGKRNLPVAGGGYFRLYPLWLTRKAIKSINREGQPAVIYLHPWEFDPEQPRMNKAPLLSRFRHYVNLQRTEQRLEKLLQEFEFAPMNQAFRCYFEDAKVIV